MIPGQPQGNSPEQSSKDKVLADYAIRLGLLLPDAAKLEKEMAPALNALNKKIKALGEDLEKTHPLFAPSKLTLATRSIAAMFDQSEKGAAQLNKSLSTLGDALGDKIGLGKHWVTNTSAMIKYAMMSKNVADMNKELYESMGPLGKAMVSAVSWMSGDKKETENKKKSPVDEATEAADKIETHFTESTKRYTKASAESIKDLCKKIEQTLNERDKLLNQAKEPPKEGALHPSQLAAQDETMSKLTETLGSASKATGEFTEASEAASLAGGDSAAAFASMGVEATVATGGLVLIAAAVAAVAIAFGAAFATVVSARDAMTAFDKTVMGVGEKSLRSMQLKLYDTNDSIKDLGISIGKVNESILNMMHSGISFAQATDKTLIRTVEELSGVTGVAADEIGSFYASLIKNAKLSIDTIRQSANQLVRYNQVVGKFGDLAQISFNDYKEAIDSSTVALTIAQRRGSDFAKSMMSDLTALTGVTTTLGLSISDINGKFEEASNLLSSPDSGFRTLLAVSGGAGIKNMLDDSFDKTTAMLKAIDWMQNLNTQFQGNINLTAQVVAQSFGLSKEAAVKLLNTTKEQQAHMREMQQLAKNLQEDVVSAAYKNVTNTLNSQWEKIKASAMNLFERSVGNSTGMSTLLRSLESMATKVSDLINGPTAKKLMDIFTKFLDAGGGWLSAIIDSLDNTLGDIVDTFNSDKDKGFWATIGDVLSKTFKGLIDMLMVSMDKAGQLLGQGLIKVIKSSSPTLGLLFSDSSQSDKSDDELRSQNPYSNPAMDSVITTLANKIAGLSSGIRDDRDKLGAYSGSDDSSLTYGKDANGQERFMSVAESKYAISKDLEEKEQLKAKLEADRAAEQATRENEANSHLKAIREALTKQKESDKSSASMSFAATQTLLYLFPGTQGIALLRQLLH